MEKKKRENKGSVSIDDFEIISRGENLEDNNKEILDRVLRVIKNVDEDKGED